MHTNNIHLQTTGGYSSDLNGNVEVFNKTLKRGTGALLTNAGLPEIFWCYGAIHYSNLHNYLSYNHNKTMTAFEAWYGKKPHWHNFRVFGCDIYVIDESKSKNVLTKATKHTFLGWGASTSTAHYFDKNTEEIKRARHVYFDDYSSATPEEELSPGARLLRNTTPELPFFDPSSLHFHTRPEPNPFKHKNIIEHTVDISICTHHQYGIQITYDEHFGLPFVKKIENTSPWYLNLPGNFRRNVWILAINSSEPITPTSAYEAIAFHSKKSTTLFISLSKWEPTTRTKLQSYRTQFD